MESAENAELNLSDLIRFLKAEHINGFGFLVGDSGTICIAKIGLLDDEKTITEKLRRITTSKTVYADDYLGWWFVYIHYSEWEHIPSILQGLIYNCEWVTPTSFLGDGLGVVFKQNEVFNWHNLETRAIHEFRIMACKSEFSKRGEQKKAWQEVFKMNKRNRVLTKHWNWRTEEGRVFCAQLRKALDKKPFSLQTPHYAWPGFDETCQKFGVLYRGKWSAFDYEILVGGYGYVEKKRKRDDDEGEAAEEKKVDDNPGEKKAENAVAEAEDKECCMVCYDNKANTLVLPCMHCVVCSECSQGLKNTADRSICVQCRRSITDVLEDE